MMWESDVLDGLAECAKPLVVDLPDSTAQILVRLIFGDDGLIKRCVDYRQRPEHTWIPVELCGGRFEVRE